MKLNEFEKCFGHEAKCEVEGILKLRHPNLMILSRNSKKIPYSIRSILHGLDDSNRVVLFDGPKSKFVIDYDKYFCTLKAIKIRSSSGISSSIITIDNVKEVLNKM